MGNIRPFYQREFLEREILEWQMVKGQKITREQADLYSQSIRSEAVCMPFKHPDTIFLARLSLESDDWSKSIQK